MAYLRVWKEFSFTFNSGASTSALFEIVNLDTSYGGSDFALDDLSLSEVNAPVPIPAAAWLFGCGLLGLIGLDKRKRRV